LTTKSAQHTRTVYSYQFAVDSKNSLTVDFRLSTVTALCRFAFLTPLGCHPERNAAASFSAPLALNQVILRSD